MGGLVDAVFGGGDAPPPPDYAPVAQASKEVQQLANEQAQRQLEENKRQFDSNREVADRVVNKQLELMDQTKAQGDDYFNYSKTFRPLEQQMAEQAAAGDPAAAAERQAMQNMGRAQADTLLQNTTNFQNQQTTQAAQLQDMQMGQANELNTDTAAYMAKAGIGADALRNVQMTQAGEFDQRARDYEAAQTGRADELAQTGANNASTLAQRTQNYEANQTGRAQQLQDTAQANAQTLRERVGAFEQDLNRDIGLATGGNSGIRDRFAADIQDDVGLAVADARTGQTQALNTAARQALRYGLSVPANMDALTTTNATQLAAAANNQRNASTDRYRNIVTNGIGLKQGAFSQTQGELGSAMSRDEAAMREGLDNNQRTFTTGQAAMTDSMNRQETSMAGRMQAGRDNFMTSTAALTDSANRATGALQDNMAFNRDNFTTGMGAKMAGMGLQTSALQGSMAANRDTFVTGNAAMTDAFNRDLNTANTSRNQRIQDDSLAWAKRLDVTGMARGLPGASQGAYGLSINAGNSANQNQMAPGQSYLANMNQANNTQLQGNQVALSGLTNILNNQNQGFLTGRGQNLDAQGAVLGAAAGFAFSDPDLKTGVKKVGKDEKTGLNKYQFKYKGGKTRFEGVMANEVEDVDPSAVVYTEDGTRAVNYAKLGIRFKEVA